MSKLKQRWVVKIGSALLTNNGQGLDKNAIADWVRQIVQLKNQGIDVVLVSSGAIAEGMKRLNWQEKPKKIHALQAAAAVGQMGLIQTYEALFRQYQIHTAQILLTHENFNIKTRYDNIFATIEYLLSLNIVPIVNENDTVATEEIKLGDNDTLAALVANLIKAQKLIILTDQGGVFDADPRQVPNAKLIHKININDPKLEKVASRMGGSLGSGGMYTKVLAAKQAQKSQTITHIASGKENNVLTRLAKGEQVGTLINATKASKTTTSDAKVIAYIGLGSNLNNPKQQLKTAMIALEACVDIEVLFLSKLYQSKPIDNSKQPDYYNCVTKIKTKLTPLNLLNICQQIEHNQHRVKEKKWGARTIDLDILLYGNEQIKTTKLTVPHPEISKRAFVLKPLSDIDADLDLPDLGLLSKLLLQVDLSELKNV